MSKPKDVYYNTKFLSYGHVCEFQLPSNEIEDLRRKGLFIKLLRKWRRITNVDSACPLTRMYLRSQIAIDEEMTHYQELKYFILHPLSQLYRWWKKCYILTVFIGCLLNPIEKFLILPFNDYDIILDCFCSLADVICMIDFMTRFIVGYYDVNYNFEHRHRKIAVQYFKTNFIWILLISVPYSKIYDFYTSSMHEDNIDPYFIYYRRNMHYLNILHYFRIVVIHQYYQQVGIALELENYCRTMFETVAIVTCTLIWLSCLQIFTYPGDTSSWIYRDKISTKSTIERLVACVLVTISCVSHSTDNNYFLPPYSTLSIIMYRIIMMFVLAQAVRLSNGKFSATIEYNSMVSQLEYYMGFKKLPEHIRMRMRRYYAYRFNKFYFQEEEIISSTSGQLHQDLIINNCRRMLKNVALFRKMPYALLQQVILRLRNDAFTINEVQFYL